MKIINLKREFLKILMNERFKLQKLRKFHKMIKNSSKSSKTCQNPGVPGVSKIRQKMAQNGHFWSKMVLPYLWLKFF